MATLELIPACPAYHAHIYFDAATRDAAVQLSEQADSRFKLSLGRVHEKPVGPHPRWSRQLAFGADQFEQLIPWLEQHRQGLTVFVHGCSGDDWLDHTEHARWLGQPAQLDLSIFKPS